MKVYYLKRTILKNISKISERIIIPQESQKNKFIILFSIDFTTFKNKQDEKTSALTQPTIKLKFPEKRVFTKAITVKRNKRHEPIFKKVFILPPIK